MLEVRYNTETRELTGWCGDPKQFGNLDRGRDNEAIIVLDIPIPDKSITALLYDEATQTLIDNPDYIEPAPQAPESPRDLATKVSELETRIEKLERR